MSLMSANKAIMNLAMTANNLNVRVESLGSQATQIATAFGCSLSPTSQSAAVGKPATLSSVLGDVIDHAAKLCSTMSSIADEVCQSRDLDKGGPQQPSDTLPQRALVLRAQLLSANRTAMDVARAIGCEINSEKPTGQASLESLSGILQANQDFVSDLEEALSRIGSHAGNVNGGELMGPSGDTLAINRARGMVG